MPLRYIYPNHKTVTSYFGVIVFLLSLFAVFLSIGHLVYTLNNTQILDKQIALFVPIVNATHALHTEKVNGKFFYLYPVLAFVAFAFFWYLVNNPQWYPELLSLGERDSMTQRNITKVCYLFSNMLFRHPILKNVFYFLQKWPVIIIAWPALLLSV